VIKKIFSAVILVSLAFGAAYFFFPKPKISPINPISKISATPSLHPTAYPRQTTLIAVGDIMLGRNVNKKMHDYKNFSYPFVKVSSLLSSGDITFGNLESPFFNNCPVVGSGTFKFCGDYRAMQGILASGFDVFSIENNHALNYGKEGREQTIELLENNHILPSSTKLLKMEKNATTFGFLSFDLTVSNDTKPVLKAVRENVSQVDILVVSLHWGVEYEKEPRAWQRQLAHEIIDAEAKLVIGHHPHVTQPTEKYKNGLIFYSLGNFVFDQMWSEETKKGKIGKVVFEDKDIKSWEEIPVYIIDYAQPQLVQ
jgi:poly-gamma-glutamate synthesis protein (capsule biosynthesis protein)